MEGSKLTIGQIITFIQDEIGSDYLNLNTDLFGELGVYGDDLTDLLVAYAEQFRVDMSDYLWYFHNEEEGFNLGALLVKPPYDLVERIPITPNLLYKSALTQKWMVVYPDHQLPRIRFDSVINWVIHILLIMAAALISILLIFYH